MYEFEIVDSEHELFVSATTIPIVNRIMVIVLYNTYNVYFCGSLHLETNCAKPAKKLNFHAN